MGSGYQNKKKNRSIMTDIRLDRKRSISVSMCTFEKPFVRG